MEIKGNIHIIRKFVRKIIKDLEEENEGLRSLIKDRENDIFTLESVNEVLRIEIATSKREVK